MGSAPWWLHWDRNIVLNSHDSRASDGTEANFGVCLPVCWLSTTVVNVLNEILVFEGSGKENANAVAESRIEVLDCNTCPEVLRVRC